MHEPFWKFGPVTVRTRCALADDVLILTLSMACKVPLGEMPADVRDIQKKLNELAEQPQTVESYLKAVAAEYPKLTIWLNGTAESHAPIQMIHNPTFCTFPWNPP